MFKNEKNAPKKMLLVGLDYSGKTTMIKKFASEIVENEFELVMTTPFINLEKITLPHSNEQCLVFDMSG